MLSSKRIIHKSTWRRIWGFKNEETNNMFCCICPSSVRISGYCRENRFWSRELPRIEQCDQRLLVVVCRGFATQKAAGLHKIWRLRQGHGTSTKLKPVLIQWEAVWWLTYMCFVQFLTLKYLNTLVLVTTEVTCNLIGPIFRLELEDVVTQWTLCSL